MPLPLPTSSASISTSSILPRNIKTTYLPIFSKNTAQAARQTRIVLCNAEIKFKCFLDYAIEQGADTIATGHYARKEVRNGVHYLLKGLDQNKDQSYFLPVSSLLQLERDFPIGRI